MKDGDVIHNSLVTMKNQQDAYGFSVGDYLISIDVLGPYLFYVTATYLPDDDFPTPTASPEVDGPSRTDDGPS